MKTFLLILLSAFLFPAAFAQDSLFVTVHVIYGSKPKAPGETEWFGGKWGGHVGLEIAPDRVIHFNPGGPFKVLRRKSDPGTYAESSVARFYCTFGCDTVKTMQVRIPVTATGRDSLIRMSDHYLANSPYPYAFFGMRCAAACYHLLSHASVFSGKSENTMIRRFFYPRRLRKFLLRESRKHQWEVIINEGTRRRKWDHD